MGNRIHDIGGGGIKVGEPGEPESDIALTCRNVVSDNYIYHGGHIYLVGAGIWVGHSSNNLVSHNEIHDLYGTGISVGWTWADRLTGAWDNIIEYNHIYNIGLGVVGGGSGIYTLARQPGTKIRYNLIHDLERYTGGLAEPSFRVSHPAFGFQVDDGSAEIIFSNNVVYNVPDACYKQMGREHVVRNNIFAFSDDYQILRRRDQGSLFFEHNIVYFDNGKLFGDSWEKQNYEIDYNLYWDTSGQEIDFAGLSFEQWKDSGSDVHSMIAAPLFVNPENGDFTLKPESPAFKLGFRPIDLSDVGPRRKSE